MCNLFSFLHQAGTINKLGLQNFLHPSCQYMSPLDSVVSKQPPQSRLLNTLIWKPFWMVPKIYQNAGRNLFYSIAAMSYPCLTKLEFDSPNLLFIFFD